jgi:hypothetical protein
MNEIVADQSLTNQLRGLSGPCFVVDSAGTKLGLFCPEIDRSLYEGVEPSVSEEELSRRERAGGGRSLAEIIADLNKRQ